MKTSQTPTKAASAKTLRFAAMLSLFLLAASCVKPTPPSPKPDPDKPDPEKPAKISLSISPSSLSFSALAGSESVSVSTNAPGIVVQPGLPDWIGTDIANAAKSLSVSVSENPSTEARRATLSIAAVDEKGKPLGVSQTLEISQAGKEIAPPAASLTLSDTVVSADCAGATVRYGEAGG